MPGNRSTSPPARGTKPYILPNRQPGLRAGQKLKMDEIKVGQSELDVLGYIAETGRITLRQVADFFGRERGWSRTTIQKTLDRLIEKSLLKREQIEGVFQYESVFPAEELQSKLVDQFVRRNLGGSLKPFVAYLHGDVQLSDSDIDELKTLVEQLDQRRQK